MMFPGLLNRRWCSINCHFAQECSAILHRNVAGQLGNTCPNRKQSVCCINVLHQDTQGLSLCFLYIFILQEQLH
jgi:hypothetical protein